MITHLSTRADGACKKFKDLNEQVGEHVDAVAQSYAPIFIFQCLLYVRNCRQLSIVCLSIVFVCYNHLYVTTLTTITSFHFISQLQCDMSSRSVTHRLLSSLCLCLSPISSLL